MIQQIFHSQQFIKLRLILLLFPFTLRVGFHLLVEKYTLFYASHKNIIVLITITFIATLIGLLGIANSRDISLSALFQTRIHDSQTKPEVALSESEMVKASIIQEINTRALKKNTALHGIKREDSKQLYTEYKQFLSSNPATVELLLNAAFLAVLNDDLTQAVAYLEAAKTLSPTL